MKKRLKYIFALVIALVLAQVGLTHTLTAQTGGLFDLTWSAMDGGGGGNSTGGGFDLSDTVAQPSGSDYEAMTGGIYSLTSGFWSRQLDPALVVTLDSFTAESEGSGIRLRWVTLSEVDTLGFNLYRAPTTTATPVRINEELIPAEAPGGGGAVYDWLDDRVSEGGTYYYWLDAVALDGSAQRFGPVSATFQDPTAIVLSRLTVGSVPVGTAMLMIVAVAAFAFIRPRYR